MFRHFYAMKLCVEMAQGRRVAGSTDFAAILLNIKGLAGAIKGLLTWHVSCKRIRDISPSMFPARRYPWIGMQARKIYFDWRTPYETREAFRKRFDLCCGRRI